MVVDDGKDEAFSIATSGSLVDVEDTEIWGALSPQGITSIPGTGFYAVVDNAGREIFVVDPADWNDPDQCDLSEFSSNPKGIAYMSDRGMFAVVDSDKDKVFVVDFDPLHPQ